MVRKRGAVDHNQTEIIEALRAVGAAVLSLTGVGDGAPDLFVGFQGRFILMEVKNPKTDYGKKGLNRLQRRFHAEWGDAVCIVRSVDEALAAIGISKSRAS